MCAKHNEHPTILAEKLGYSRAAGGKWANGSVPRKATLHKIANYFNVSVDDLIADKQKENPPSVDDGLDAERNEWITAWGKATPAQRKAALAVLMLQAPTDEQ